MFILPDEARLIRHIEALTLQVATTLDFQEVLFPRAMTMSDWAEVAETLGPISAELVDELVRIPILGELPMALCHWQCEPYYRALRYLGAQTPERVVDRSGWSYRNERRLGHFRSREFLRVEFVWRGPREVVSDVHEKMLDAIQNMLAGFTLQTQRKRRDDEMRNSNQRLVLDLVATTNDGLEVEVVGSHLHGSAFVRRFWLNAPDDMETACMGISLSRIAALLLMQRDSDAANLHL